MECGDANGNQITRAILVQVSEAHYAKTKPGCVRSRMQRRPEEGAWKPTENMEILGKVWEYKR